jgi:NAD(P)-dependent dehydrogenase (short-subunit alcohol dehydrogenase family)
VTPTHDPKVVLITGCSSGIGRAVADLLADSGHRVVATARRAESLAELQRWAEPYPDRTLVHPLDVSNESSIAAAVQATLHRFARIDVLVNNAGYGQLGAVEELSLDQWRTQFETNVFGVAACIRAALPAMRAQGHGRIINVSSAVAHITTPLMGAYCASKHALESLSAALRMETAGQHIDVVMIEPGPVGTDFRLHVQRQYAALPDVQKSLYAPLYCGLKSWWEKEPGRGVTTALHVATLILRAVEARRPRMRYRISWEAHLVPQLRKLVPDRYLERYLTRELIKQGKR